jgi:hypothetical protein
MPTPQLPGFGDAAAFIRRFKDIDHRINLLFEKLNNVLANTGLSVPSPGVTQVDGSLNVVGNLNVSGSSTVSGSNGIQSSNYVAGTSGWKFNGTSLEANTGVIGNGALANPISAISAHASADTFSLATGSNVAKATATITVPSGFSKALVQAFSAISAVNPTASLDTLYVGCRINNPAGVDQNTGWSMAQAVAASTQGSVAESSTALITGLTAGQTFTVQTTASTGSAAWSASGSNVANIDATIIWLR